MTIWDGGRLTVNLEFSPLLARHGLTNFDSLMEYSAGQFAKNVLRERTTTRLELTSDSMVDQGSSFSNATVVRLSSSS